LHTDLVNTVDLILNGIAAPQPLAAPHYYHR
jgi:hypothetical protein